MVFQEGDHWWVVFWTLFGGIFAGQVSALILTVRDGKHSAHSWRVMGGTALTPCGA